MRVKEGSQFIVMYQESKYFKQVITAKTATEAERIAENNVQNFAVLKLMSKKVSKENRLNEVVTAPVKVVAISSKKALDKPLTRIGSFQRRQNQLTWQFQQLEREKQKLDQEYFEILAEKTCQIGFGA
jgi:enoyl-[acyl-carrier-protein] reductase (NADH)